MEVEDDGHEVMWCQMLRSHVERPDLSSYLQNSTISTNTVHKVAGSFFRAPPQPKCQQAVVDGNVITSQGPGTSPLDKSWRA